MRAAAKGEYTVSNSWFTQSLERMPDNGDALTSRASNYLAMAYRFRRRPEVKRSYETKALSDFERLTEINPRAYQGWLSRGLVLAELQRFEAAEQSFEHALKLAPNHRSAHFGYASYLFARAVVAEERSFAQQAQEHLDDVFPRFGSTPQSLTLYQQINDYLKRPDPPNTGAGQ
jgi:tetratricopeptide (TPR) repeat protein